MPKVEISAFAQGLHRRWLKSIYVCMYFHRFRPF